MVKTQNYNLDTDNKLGGDEASNYIISSQKAIKDYVDNAVSGSGSSIEVDNALSADSENPVQNKVITGALDKKLENNSTNMNALAIGSNVQSKAYSIAIGTNTTSDDNSCIAIGNGGIAQGVSSIAIGYGTSTQFDDNIAIGTNAISKSMSAIQLGTGTNNTRNTFQVAKHTLLNTSTGLIPDERLSDNIARKSDLDNISVSLNDITTETQRQAINSGITSDTARQIEINKNDIATNKSNIATNKSDIANLSSTVGTNANNISSLQTSVSTNTSNITNLQNTVNTHTNDISNLQTTTGTHTTQITTINSTLNNKASTSLSNLDTTGKNVMDGFPVAKQVLISNGTAVATNSYDLSSYLPNDGQSYEVLAHIQINSSNSTFCTVGNSEELTRELTEGATVFQMIAHCTSGTTMSFNTCWLPLPNAGRTIYTRVEGSKASGSCTVRLFGYRRLGTNQ